MPTGSVTPSGGSAFNGGTITKALAIRPTDNNVCLDVQPTATSNSNGIVFIAQDQDLDTGDPLALRVKPSGGSYGDVLRVNANGTLSIAPARATVDLLQVVLFSGTTVLRVAKSGALGIRLNTAPADNAVTASECGLWFDDANGAAGLQHKGKTADGTVRTSSYPLRQTSGGLSTVALANGVGAQISTHYDAQTVTEVQFDPGVATDAECEIELSPNDGTYTRIATEIVPAGVAFDGTVRLLNVLVPAGWFIRVTCNAQASVLGTTYY